MYSKTIAPMALNHGVSGESLAAARQLLSPDGEMIGLHVYEQPQGSVSTYLDERNRPRRLRAVRAGIVGAHC